MSAQYASVFPFPFWFASAFRSSSCFSSRSVLCLINFPICSSQDNCKILSRSCLSISSAFPRIPIFLLVRSFHSLKEILKIELISSLLVSLVSSSNCSTLDQSNWHLWMFSPHTSKVYDLIWTVTFPEDVSLHPILHHLFLQHSLVLLYLPFNQPSDPQHSNLMFRLADIFRYLVLIPT